jgi:hypothetical protein
MPRLSNYIKQQYKAFKEMTLFKYLRNEVEIGATGTQRYRLKNGKRKGKVL